MTDPAGRRWISPRDCASRLGLHPQTVYSWIAERRLPFGKIGGRVFIDWLRVERRLEKGKAR